MIDCAKAVPMLPPVRNSGTNMALTPLVANVNRFAASLSMLKTMSWGVL
jgi:hypothetical protein